MPRLIDATKWEEFYKKMTNGLKPYDHYDDGYRDAMDNVDDWMDGNQVEAEPVRNGRWGTHSDRPDSLICSVCKCGFDMWKHDPHNYCPNCGAKMRLEE